MALRYEIRLHDILCRHELNREAYMVAKPGSHEADSDVQDGHEMQPSAVEFREARRELRELHARVEALEIRNRVLHDLVAEMKSQRVGLKKLSYHDEEYWARQVTECMPLLCMFGDMSQRLLCMQAS